MKPLDTNAEVALFREAPAGIREAIGRDSTAKALDLGTSLSRALLGVLTKEGQAELRKIAAAPRDGAASFAELRRLGNALVALGCCDGADRFADARSVLWKATELAGNLSLIHI